MIASRPVDNGSGRYPTVRASSPGFQLDRPVKRWYGAEVALGGTPGGIVQSTLGNAVLPLARS